MLKLTRERWAQLAITIQFLIVIRALGEFFRLKYALGANFSTQTAMPYIRGALLAACSCWAGVTLFFFRRYSLCVWIAGVTVLALLLYKVAVIGW